MTDPETCPQCSKPEFPKYLTRGEGQLEQCGRTHLPTITWSCECGYKRWESATGATWRTDVVVDRLTGERLTRDRVVPGGDQ